MLKIITRAALSLIVLLIAVFSFAFFSSRPPLTIDPATLANDTEGAVLFTIGEREFCPRTSASMAWNNGILDFNVFGWGPVVVRRYPAGDQMVWEYADGSVTRMDRICKLPEVHKNSKPRGRAISFFAAET